MKKLFMIILSLFVLLLVVGGIVAYFEGDGIVIGDRVALIRLEGPILDSSTLVQEIRDYVQDSSVKVIVLRVDSPGGAVAPSQEIYDEVKRAAAVKDVIGSMGSLAASGGYYVLAPATKIVANPGSLTGSIGVIMEIPNIQGLMEKLGIKTTVIKSGKHKDIASTLRDLTDEEIALLQAVMDDVHEQFIQAVADGRHIPIEDVRKFADGRIMSGRQALKLGLVDQLGSLQDAIALGARLAGISGEPHVVYREKERSIFDMLRGSISAGMPDVFPSVKIKYMFSP